MSSSSIVPPIVYYERIVKEALSSGAAVIHDWSNVVRVSPTMRVGDILSLLSQSRFGPTSFVASFLAVQDFNNRNSSFVNNLPQLTEDCDFYMTIRYRAPQYNPVQNGRFFQEEYLLSETDVRGDNKYNNDNENNSNDNKNNNNDIPKVKGMAILGPTRSVEAELIAKMGGSIPAKTSNEAKPEIPTSEGTGTSAATGLVNQGAIPNIATTATSAQLEDRIQYPYFARTTPTNRVDAIALGWYLKSIGVRRLAVLHVSDSYGRAYVMGLREAARMHDIRLLVVSYTDGMSESLRGAIDTLASANYTYHMLIPTTTDEFWIPVLRQLFDASLMGVNDNMWFFADSLPVIERQLEEPWMGKALNRSAGVFMANSKARNQAMDARFGPVLDNDEWLEYFLSKQVTGPLTETANVTQFRSEYRDKINAHLPSLNTYDAVMTLGLAACQTPQDFFTGSELYESVKRVEFRGASGKVGFDRTTATRPFASVAIFNVIVNVHENATDGLKSMVIDPENGSIETLNPLLFTDGSTNPPPSLPPLVEDMNLLTKGEQAACWAVAGAVLAFAAGCAIWIVVNREKPSVKASQPVFLFLLAVGSFIVASAIIPTTFQEPMAPGVLDAGCMAIVWQASIGFSTAFGSLFSKTRRIHRVFKESRKGRRIQIQVQDVLIPVLVLLATNIILLVLWTLVAPLSWSRIQTDMDSYGRTTSSVGTCMRFSGPAQIAFLSSIIGVNFVALCFSNWMAYQARNLPSQFNDNPYIGIANIVLLECAIVGAPILFVTSGDPSSFIVVNSLLLAIISAAILLPAVLPFTLKPRARGIRRVDFQASNRFDPDKAQCDIRHFPALSSNPRMVFGASQVRVTGLALTTTTQTGISTGSTQMRSSYSLQSLAFNKVKSAASLVGLVRSNSTTQSQEMRPCKSGSSRGQQQLLTMDKAGSSRAAEQADEIPDVAVMKATVNDQVRSRRANL